ncbi:aldehyde dehydrogenase family 3 member b1-like [Pitangus sulphuratus]|nr:aldehyde dehydrogenase family 3 member b1-like [Pitangus sulphuratus]
METDSVFLQPTGSGAGDATSGNPYAGLVSHLRASWLSRKTRPMEYRVAQLEALGHFLDEKKQAILEATAVDMGKPPFEVELSEVFLCKNELHETLNNLSHWMKDKQVDRPLVLERTSSGGFCGNDTLMQVTLTSLPFGGIGNSGLGMYHGKFSFDTFSHCRGCLKRGMGWEALNAPRYPPYSQKKFGIIRATSKVTRKSDCVLL